MKNIFVGLGILVLGAAFMSSTQAAAISDVSNETACVSVLTAWFDTLQTVRESLLQSGRSESANLKAFSLTSFASQALDADTEVAYDLSRALFGKYRISTPVGMFSSDNADKNMQWFVAHLIGPVEPNMLTCVYTIAVSTNPALKDRTPDDVSGMTLKQIFGTAPYEQNPDLKEINDEFSRAIPSDFYPGAKILENTGVTVKQILKRVMHNGCPGADS